MDDPREVRAALDAALRRLLHAYELFDTRWRVDWGLAPSEKLVVTHLWAAEAASMSELAGIAGMSTGGATAVVDRLERDGYVERHPDPNDRRRQLVGLTDHGRAVRSRLDAVIGRAVESIAGDADPKAFEAIADEFERDAGTLGRHLEERARVGGRVPPLTG